MKRTLLRIWGMFPTWIHTLAMNLLLPRFRMAVGGLVFNEQGQVLLFKHTYRKFPWGIPAGGLEPGEQPADGIVREFHEETGLTIHPERILLAYNSPYFQHVSLLYLCKIVAGEFRESAEISAIQYFDVEHLPPMLFDEKDLIRSIHKTLFTNTTLENSG